MMPVVDFFKENWKPMLFGTLSIALMATGIGFLVYGIHAFQLMQSS